MKPRARDPRDPDPRADGVRVSTASDSAERAAAALLRASPGTGVGVVTSARCPTPPSEGPDPTVTPIRIGCESTGANTSGWPTSKARRSTTSRWARGPGSTSCSSTDCPGAGRTGLENLPHFARNHVLAPDLPGFGASPMPPWEVSDRSLRPAPIDFCTAAGSATAPHRQLDGRLHLRRGGHHRADRFAKLVLVSSAGASHARMLHEPIEATGRMLAAAAPLLLKAQQRSALRPRLRDAASG